MSGDVLTPAQRAERLASALIDAANQEEYLATIEAAQREGAPDKDILAPWYALARIAIRDGLKSDGAIVDEMPVSGIPGFRQVNDELRAALGKVVAITRDGRTNRVTRIALEPEGLTG